MWMRVSASTMRVRVAFSIVNLVLPSCGPRGGRKGLLSKGCHWQLALVTL